MSLAQGLSLYVFGACITALILGLAAGKRQAHPDGFDLVMALLWPLSLVVFLLAGMWEFGRDRSRGPHP